MKLNSQLTWVLLCRAVLASPLQIDVNVHLDIDETSVVTHNVEPTPTCYLAAKTSTKTLPTVNLGYLIQQASPNKTARNEIQADAKC